MISLKNTNNNKSNALESVFYHFNFKIFSIIFVQSVWNRTLFSCTSDTFYSPLSFHCNSLWHNSLAEYGRHCCVSLFMFTDRNSLFSRPKREANKCAQSVLVYASDVFFYSVHTEVDCIAQHIDNSYLKRYNLYHTKWFRLLFQQPKWQIANYCIGINSIIFEFDWKKMKKKVKYMNRNKHIIDENGFINVYVSGYRVNVGTRTETSGYGIYWGPKNQLYVIFFRFA